MYLKGKLGDLSHDDAHVRAKFGVGACSLMEVMQGLQGAVRQ